MVSGNREYLEASFGNTAPLEAAQQVSLREPWQANSNVPSHQYRFINDQANSQAPRQTKVRMTDKTY